MKKNVILLLVGMVLVVIGAFLKISHNHGLSTFFFIAGLGLEAYTLGSLVIQSLKKVK